MTKNLTSRPSPETTCSLENAMTSNLLMFEKLCEMRDRNNALKAEMAKLREVVGFHRVFVDGVDCSGLSDYELKARLADAIVTPAMARNAIDSTRAVLGRHPLLPRAADLIAPLASAKDAGGAE